MVFQLTERNLILTGYVEPNKARIGRQVAERLRMPFVDIEERIEQRFGDDLQVIRQQYGERRLKSAEVEMMEEAYLYRHTLIRVNGSALMHGEHYAKMSETSVIICLVARLDAILQRMHLAMGARFHDPQERAFELGNLRREWEIRKMQGLIELDVSYHDEASIVKEIIEVWQKRAILGS